MSFSIKMIELERLRKYDDNEKICGVVTQPGSDTMKFCAVTTKMRSKKGGCAVKEDYTLKV